MRMTSSPLIDELRDILATAFASGVVSAAAEIDRHLQELTNQTDAADKKRDVIAARHFISGSLPAFERMLLADFRKSFDEKLAGETGQFSKTQTFSLDSLSLVEDTDVDENILIANTGRRLREDCDYEFFALSRRLEILLKVEHLEDGHNPTAPRAFCRSFLAALTAIDVQPVVRVHIFNAAKSALTRILQTTYRNANEFLMNKGVLIEIHKTYGKPVLSAESRIVRSDIDHSLGRTATGVAMSAGMPVQNPVAPTRVEADDEQADEMDTLFSQLLARHSGIAAPTALSAPTAVRVPHADDLHALLALLDTSSPGYGLNVEAGGRHSMLSADLASALEQLSGQMAFLTPDEPAAGRSASVLPTHLLHTARVELAAQMRPAEMIITDLVVGMFDGIFAAPELPDAIKAQISRLQFPMLKSAMLDASLLTDDSHPLRILIDQLADLSRRHGARLQPGDVVFDRVRTLLQYLLAILESDPLAMTDVNEQLQDLIEAEDDKAQQSIAASVAQQLEAERQQRALAIATYEIERRIANPAIPEVVKLFARKAWRWLLMIDYLAGGEDSDDWKKDIATVDDLLWSVIPSSASEARLPVLILQLVARLNEALNRAGVARTERVAFYDRLAEVHREILDPAASSNARRANATAATAALAALVDPRTQTRQRSLKLARNAWIATRVNGIGAQQCRLLWISPLQESFIFRNYSAADAENSTVVMSAEDLDEAFKRGIVTVMDNTHLTRRSIEGALRAMLGKTGG